MQLKTFYQFKASTCLSAHLFLGTLKHSHSTRQHSNFSIFFSQKVCVWMDAQCTLKSLWLPPFFFDGTTKLFLDTFSFHSFSLLQVAHIYTIMNNHQFLSVRCHRLSIRLPKRGRVRPTRVVGEIISIHISSPPQKYPAMVVGVGRPGSDMATGTLRGERKLRSRRVLRISEVFLGRVPPLNCVLFAQAELK